MSFSRYVEQRQHEFTQPQTYGGRYAGVQQSGNVGNRLNMTANALDSRSYMTPAQMGATIMKVMSNIPWTSRQQPVQILMKVIQDIRGGALQSQQPQPQDAVPPQDTSGDV